MVDYMDDIVGTVVDAEQIQARVSALAQRIQSDVQGQSVTLVGVLNGAYMFLADLSRALTCAHEVSFIAVSSYGAGTRSTGGVQLVMDVRGDIAGKHVVVIEDIVDTGRTVAFLRRHLMARNPASVRICALLDKPSRREVQESADYIGFQIPDLFVVGYGLDFAGAYRHLPFVAELKPAVFGLGDASDVESGN